MGLNFNFLITSLTMPCSSITNVVRTIPILSLPNDFLIDIHQLHLKADSLGLRVNQS